MCTYDNLKGYRYDVTILACNTFFYDNYDNLRATIIMPYTCSLHTNRNVKSNDICGENRICVNFVIILKKQDFDHEKLKTTLYVGI